MKTIQTNYKITFGTNASHMDNVLAENLSFSNATGEAFELAENFKNTDKIPKIEDNKDKRHFYFVVNANTNEIILYYSVQRPVFSNI